MGQREPRKTTNLATLYDEELMPWSRAAQALGAGSLGPELPCFLGTVRPNGRPHAAGVGVVVHAGDLFFTSGATARKARNLVANPACTLSMRLDGIDLVLEGEAHRTIDPDTLTTVAAAYDAGGWLARAEGDAITAPYSAQSAGPGPWLLFRFRIRTAFRRRLAAAARRQPLGLLGAPPTALRERALPRRPFARTPRSTKCLAANSASDH